MRNHLQTNNVLPSGQLGRRAVFNVISESKVDILKGHTHLMKLGPINIDELRTQNPDKYKSYSKYLLQLNSYDDNNENEERRNCERIMRFLTFSFRRRPAAYYKKKDCNIIYRIENPSRTQPKHGLQHMAG